MWLQVTCTLLHNSGTPTLADFSIITFPHRDRRGNSSSTVSVLVFFPSFEISKDFGKTSNRVPAAPAFCGQPKLSPPETGKKFGIQTTILSVSNLLSNVNSSPNSKQVHIANRVF